MPFLLGFSALAAGLLFVLSILIQRQSLPVGSGLEARQLEPAPWESEQGRPPSGDAGDPDETDNAADAEDAAARNAGG